MAGIKEIRRKIQSVLNTKKITYAMKLVSAAKLKKAQDSVGRARGYTDALNAVVAAILSAGTTAEHPLITARQRVKSVRIVVVGGSRGLCGSYNSAVHRKLDAFIRQLKEKRGIEKVDIFALGKKPGEHCRRMKHQIARSFDQLAEDANRWPIEDITFAIEQDFLNETVDEVWILYTKFKNALSMTVQVEQLLPIDPRSLVKATPTKETGAKSEVVFEPSVTEVFGALLPRIFRSNVRQACLDSKASEHASRMTAMEAATKNATDLAGRLKLTANKLRQAAVTKDLLDIVGGAEALNA